ncbi:MAG: hypothetical protein ACREJ5_26270, partial [Geminicoccaceae bacterium]
FITGNDGRVYTSWWFAGADWSGINDNWRSIGGVFPPGAPLGAVARNPGQLDVFITGNDGRVYTSWWSDVPPITTRQFTISRHNTATVIDAEADSILNDASTVLQVSHGPDDVACPVALVRSGNVGVFNTGDGSLDTAAETSAVFSLPGNVKVVADVNFCGDFNTSYIGCGQTPGTSYITERFIANQEGILWAHEFGHNQGLPHRDTSTNNVMYRSIGTDRQRVNQAESNAFLGQQGQIAAAGQVVPAQARTPSGAPMPVEEFVTQIYFHGLPLDQAATYGEEDVETLIGMLNDPSMVQFHENIALTLGMIGDARAVDPLISFVREGAAGAEAAMSRPAYKGRVGAVVALATS